jgi:hypothetical protein
LGRLQPGDLLFLSRNEEDHRDRNKAASMTKVAQVRKSVRALVKRHDDLVMANSWVLMKPARHFVRAVLVSGTSSPEHFEARWTVMHLFEVRNSIHLNWSAYLWDRRRPNPGFWWETDDGVEQSLVDAIETQALPVLRHMRTLDDFLAYLAGNPFGPHLLEYPWSRIVLDVALGDLDHARAIAATHRDQWSPALAYDEDGRAAYVRLSELCRLLMADDRAGLIRLLYEWEATTVKRLKIEHIWEPTPFPIELRS